MDIITKTPVHQLSQCTLREASPHDGSCRQQIDLLPILLEGDRDAILGPGRIMLGLLQINISDLDVGATGQIEHRHLFPRSIGNLQMDPGSSFTPLMQQVMRHIVARAGVTLFEPEPTVTGPLLCRSLIDACKVLQMESRHPVFERDGSCLLIDEKMGLPGILSRCHSSTFSILSLFLVFHLKKSLSPYHLAFSDAIVTGSTLHGVPDRAPGEQAVFVDK